MADPKIKYDIEANVSGQGDVGQLAASVEKLAGTLDGELKTSALASAAALRQLAEKDGAVQNFVELKNKTQQAAAGLKEAQSAAQKLGAELAATANPTRAQTGQMQKLRDAVSSAKVEVVASNSALNQARDGLDKYGINTGNLSQKQIALRQSLGQVRTDVQAMVPAWQASANATASSAESQNRSHRAIKSGVSSISEQLSFLTKAAGAYAAAGQFTGLIKDVAATADAYNNLQARVKLVTGEGAAFEAAFEGVSQVAQRTSTSLESTGTLFAKLSEAGKALGVGQSEALRLTETVNQAIQLSGASAQASEAAVTQLIQGLQSGVLRGDEFNSVMEQSPRLARALADGLGKTTGELRKMAEAGQLSSDVVIKALQGQSDAVATEFEKLPPTVGRAIQNLSTNWTLYVGETDKATGASKTAAKAIDALANNLSTIAGYLVDAGQAAAAFTAIKLAQHFLGIGTAAVQATAAVVGNTAAVAAAGTASTGAAVSVGRFASILSSLKLFSLLGIVTNFKDIGTAIGEAAARLAGYKDRTDEIARSDKLSAAIAADTIAMRKRMADGLQDAIDKQFELSKGAKAVIAEFDKLTKAGDTSAEAIAKIGKDFDLTNSQGIRDASAVLDKLAADGKLSASEVQQAWAKALDGKDLAVFEVMAKAAFTGVAREAERLAQVSGAVLQEAIKRSGLDLDVISGGIGKAARSAINDTDAIIQGLDKLKAQGIDTGQVLTASIGKGIKTADSQQAIEALQAQIESLRAKLGDKLTDGLLDQAKQKANELKDAIDKATPGVNSLREAYATLGLKTSEELGRIAKANKGAWEEIRKDGTASADTLRTAFTKYAASAIEANGGVATETLKIEAAVRGVTIAVDANGKATVANAEKSKKAIEDAARAYIPWGEAAEKAAAMEVLAREKVIAVREKENDLIQRTIDLENKRRGVDKEGFSTDKTGGRIVAGGDLNTLTGIAAFLKSAGVADDAKARNIAREFADSRGNVQYFDNPGQMKYGGAGSTISQALLKAAERYTFGIGGDGSGGAGGGQQPSTIPNPSAATVNVRITLPNGTTQTVPTTQEGSQALIAALQAAKLSAGA